MAFGKIRTAAEASPEQLEQLTREVLEQAAEEPGALPLPGGAVAPDPATLEEFRVAEEALRKAMQYAEGWAEREVTAANKNELADVLKALNDASKDAEATRKKLTKAYDSAKGRVKAAFDEARALPDATLEALKGKLVALEREERRQREEDEKREREEAAKAQEVENQRAAEEGRSSHHIAPPAPRKPVTGARGRSSGTKASPTERLKYRIVAEDQLPDEYKVWEPNRGKILADVRQGVVIPGVEPYVDDEVRLT